MWCGDETCKKIKNKNKIVEINSSKRYVQAQNKTKVEL